MFRANIIISSIISFLSVSCSLQAQSTKAMLMQFNTMLGENYKVTVKGKTLIVDGFREGDLVKQDRVNMFDLDVESLEFSEHEQAVIIRCYTDYDDCITSTLTRERKKKSFRKRLIFSAASAHSGVEIEEAFKKLLSIYRN